MSAYISVIICTYVRTHRLIECLESLEKQTLDTDQFEVVIVSRNLIGENEKKLDEFLSNSPLKTIHIREERPGLSVARNTGLDNAEGEIIHFLDDDTIAVPGCLEAYIDVFNSMDALCVGGKILPKFTTPPPTWLQPGQWAFLGTLDLGDEICSFSFPSNFPVGANIAFRRKVFDRFGLFDEELGIHGSKSVGGEETDLCYRINTAGEELLYCPEALAYHCIEADKLSKKWMRRIAYRQGRGAAILQIKHSSPINVIRSNLASFSRSRRGADTHSTKPSDWRLHRRAFYLETKIALAAGYAVEMLKALFR